MKAMKKFLSLIICVMMVGLTVMSFAGCNDGEQENQNDTTPTEKASIIGDWTTDMDISGSIKSALKIINPQMHNYIEIGKIVSSVTFTFKDDGTYSVVVNKKEDLQKKLTELESKVPDGISKQLEVIIKAHGNGETPEEWCQKQDNMTLQEEADDFVKKWNLAKFTEDAKGQYKLDGDTLFLGTETNIIEDRFFTVSLGVDSLKVKYSSKPSFAAYDMSDILPLTLKKD